jgi:hypothetical protein
MFSATIEQLISEEESLDPLGDELEQHNRYLNRCRRVPVGPSVVVVFENTRTLTLRLRELTRVAKLTHPDNVTREMNWYRTLLPGQGRLLASISVRGADRDLADALAEGDIRLVVGPHAFRGIVREEEGGDRIVGSVRWVEFVISRECRPAFDDETLPVSVRIDAGNYSHESPPLSDKVRISLLDDLVSERD